jgi:hypothetical protein
MSELINYNPDLKQRKIGVRESFESKCTYTIRILLSSNSAVLINIITGVWPPRFDFVVFYYVLCQC